MSVRHFLSLRDISAREGQAIIKRACELKKLGWNANSPTPLKYKSVAMIFDKPSTRTRTSFEVGISQLGGVPLYQNSGDLQLGRGEPAKDTARVLSRMVDAIVMRTGPHEYIEELANWSSIPVINALTDLYHPCQLLADMMTWYERVGDIAGKSATWVGDGNNVCHSFINAAVMFDFTLNICTPKGYEPNADIVAYGGTHVHLKSDITDAITGANLVVTDTWASMGQEGEKTEREVAFCRFKITDELMNHAANDALFMHCLPAYRGSEVDESVLEGAQSVIWDEAENRLHAQKALLEYLIQ